MGDFKRCVQQTAKIINFPIKIIYNMQTEMFLKVSQISYENTYFGVSFY